MAKRKSQDRGKRRTRKRGKVRKPLKTVLIACEGKETEPTYFSNFKSKLRDIARIEVVGGDRCGTSPSNVAEWAAIRNDVNQYDHVWAVFDHDGRTEKEIQQGLDKAKDENIDVAYSNPCFEFWYLIHFRDYNAYIECRDVIRLLRKDHIRKYEKTLDVYHDLELMINDAMKRSIELRSFHERNGDKSDENPSTTVDKLVQELRKLG